MYDNNQKVERPSERRSRNDELLREEEFESHHRMRWIVSTLVLAAIIGLGWYFYPTLSQAPAMMAQLPGLQKSFGEVGSRVTATEARLQDWLAGQNELQQRVADLQKETESRFRYARKQAGELRAELYKRIHGEVLAQTQVLETQVAKLEARSESDQALIEKLQTDLAALREESEKQAAQLDGVHSQIERDSANRDQQFASLNDQVGSESRDLQDLSKKLAVKRVNFEVTRNHSQDLGDGISLGITGTDVSHRRVNGWMWVMPDRRTVWLHDQGAQQPVIFYGVRDGKRKELVITNVTRDSITGYLLLPA
jgi:predicted transcriptional regulator